METVVGDRVPVYTNHLITTSSSHRANVTSIPWDNSVTFLTQIQFLHALLGYDADDRGVWQTSSHC